jgi:hypothetical protein
MALPVGDFIGRFLLHILPPGFQKVRAYGWLAPRRKDGALAAIRAFLGAQPPVTAAPTDETPVESVLRLTGIDVTRCPFCATGHLVCIGELPPSREPVQRPRSRDGPA